MESHTSFPVLSPFIAKYPRASSSLVQAYNDIVYAQQWNGVEVIDLESCSRGAIKGKKAGTEETLYVVPCALAETLSFAWLQDAFAQLFPKPSSADTSETNTPADSTTPFLYLAITSQDASIVYYKLSKGIVKPPV
ncbi:tRNA intron endonuclease [Flammula alnicola]|nr:tRNA intron endonuclease [Flammula alnicola]